MIMDILGFTVALINVAGLLLVVAGFIDWGIKALRKRRSP